ncbi:hypothetical protein E2562_008619 [Oryza meyeriana var. granulata]|uniref:Pentatricopeptide repeat-containing protein n=1 Tax=Oryza meyeriana var. granulata TaxID=110450 RepID=A0A6G1C695_9ORYZ|nr:hypothetical protein E2562_008619 [Oryza meyeriana var. granulata]
MDHVGSMEERVVTERIRRKLEEVNAAAQKHLAGVQDHVNFTMQARASLNLFTSFLSPSRVFDAVPRRDAYMWNTLLRAHAHAHSHVADALVLYTRMRAAGVAPDHYTYPIVLPACAAARARWFGRAAHGDAVRFALARDGFVSSALIAMYCQEGDVADAEHVFAEIGGARTVVSWTAMVAGYVQNCFFGEAVALFGAMVSGGVLPNEITPVSCPAYRGKNGYLLGRWFMDSLSNWGSMQIFPW